MKSNAFVVLLIIILLIACEPRFFNIPTPSMEATLPVGSKIFVGTAEGYKHYDVVSFRWPEDDDFYVSRILAMPGDLFEIRNDQVYRNEILEKDTSTIQYAYIVYSDMILNERVFNEAGIPDFQWQSGGYFIHATNKAMKKIKKNRWVSSVEKVEGSEHLYDDFRMYPWNTRNLGPLLVPRKGLTIQLTADNRQLYKTILDKYETADYKDAKDYTFQQDYVFVMSDNRDNALDSRYHGFLPAENIHGVAYNYKF